ncbi:tRNA uridine-5-carboxymethylaminomethyl(34) synthesis GTPase MnmE [Buchnera aphidicola]|uniref:tRNA modification GTPase MnmE n=1 Tax=Buchnera aphidicola (Anoecia oenotherae) TaxID=1241833 RepID=A0A4D6XUH3_9GAMM|nr:tRNA uridine-5-carboxymethylaminomethyl(34) synthesis GTPase MnmE [Buchnera aphidicola]QCI19159.1 tRNA uridine-5-carboxymethylaminomethyl(34) synthesis GTPase MnmE [Buchnera aphidicola (Anoecia oenotherae)]
MTNSKTIIAQITPIGKSGVGILRISGKQCKKVAKLVLKKIPKERYAEYLDFLNYNGKIIDKGIALWFPSPNSFTGEDTLELQGHGNPIILDMLINTILTVKNVRIAHPGEFSKRAFLNGKIDLIQAEAIADLINSNTEEAAIYSLQSMTGNLSVNISNITKLIIKLRTKIETHINFSYEESIPIDINSINNTLLNILKKLKMIKLSENKGSLLHEGIQLALIGPPNTGKSTLFNRLSLNDSAIVTEIKGTTRDILQEKINLNGNLLHILDTAGLHNTNDKVEKIGIKRTWEKIKQCNYILLILDCSTSYKKNISIYNSILKSSIKENKISIIMNKCDLINKKPGMHYISKLGKCLFVSGKKNTGIHHLRSHLQKIMTNNICSEGLFISKRRHSYILNNILEFLSETIYAWKKNKNIELLAEDLRLIQKKLGKITGEFTTEDLLESIFSTFCIGK